MSDLGTYIGNKILMIYTRRFVDLLKMVKVGQICGACIRNPKEKFPKSVPKSEKIYLKNK